MSYTPLNLTDGTKVTASHTSHIEAGITDCEDQISEVKDSLSELSNALVFKRAISNAEEIDSITNSEDSGIYRFSNMPIPGTTNRWGYIINIFFDSSWGNQICVTNNATQILSARFYANGSWSQWYQANVTAI